MRRFLMTDVLVSLTVLLLCGSGSAQTQLTWWEHSNPPHNNYSKQLVQEWNEMHPNTPLRYEFFAMTPYFKKLTAALSTRSAADISRSSIRSSQASPRRACLGPSDPSGWATRISRT